MFVGEVTPGNFDVRISRPGFDAKTADVTDTSKISFAASRQNMMFVSEVGQCALRQWVTFSNIYAEIPYVWFNVKKDGEYRYSPWDTMVRVIDTASYEGSVGNFFIATVDFPNNRFQIITPENPGWTNDGTYSFSYLVMGVVS